MLNLRSLPAATMMLPKTLPSSIYTFMGCCKLAQVDVHKWLNFKSILTIRGLLMAYHLMRHYLYPHF